MPKILNGIDHRSTPLQGVLAINTEKSVQFGAGKLMNFVP
jgi:hypothetical protein